MPNIRAKFSDPLPLWIVAVPPLPGNGVIDTAQPVVDFGCSTPDPRVRTRMDLLWRADFGGAGSQPVDGTNTVISPSVVTANKAWICGRVSDGQGGAYPVTNIIGQGRTAGLMAPLLQNASLFDAAGAPVTTNILSAGNQIIGWSVETNSAIDELFGSIRMASGALATTGVLMTLILRARWIPSVEICDAEWTEIQNRCWTKNYTTQPSISNSF